MAEYFANRFRLSFPNKSIWLYSGYLWSDLWEHDVEGNRTWKELRNYYKRQQIVENCTVMVDGRYIDSQRDTSLRWRGSKNQRVINIQQSLQKGEIVLWTE